jgi:hypothetical protein
MHTLIVGGLDVSYELISLSSGQALRAMSKKWLAEVVSSLDVAIFELRMAG